jgi:hypothetical protein
MATPAKNPMKAMLTEQAIPQINMLVQMFDSSLDNADPKGKRVRDAAIEFRDALKDWAE